MELKTLTGTIYSNWSSSSDFAFLWQNLVDQMEFKKHDLNENVENEKVIYSNSKLNTQITMKFNNEIFHNICAICDGNNENRYIVLFEKIGEYCNVSTYGLIIYFNNEKQCIKKKIFNKQIYYYDLRNSVVSKFLYNQTLLFLQIHRDTRYVILTTVLLTYDDFIKSNYCFNDTVKCLDTKNIINYGRFIFIKGLDNIKFLLDLGSTKYMENHVKNEWSNNDNKKYDCIIINSYETVDESFDINEIINTTPEEYYGDGYPDNCLLCNKPTCEATYITKSESMFTTTMGLGKSYCDTCKIRFSKTNNKWECCRLNKNNCMCEGIITDSICKLDHSNDNITKIVSIEGTSNIKPFKKILTISKIVI